MIIEDDGSLLNFAQKALRQYGYRVLTAKNGGDALRISKDYEEPIDLIVTDVVMPTMNGKEITGTEFSRKAIFTGGIGAQSKGGAG